MSSWISLRSSMFFVVTSTAVWVGCDGSYAGVGDESAAIGHASEAGPSRVAIDSRLPRCLGVVAPAGEVAVEDLGNSGRAILYIGGQPVCADTLNTLLADGILTPAAPVQFQPKAASDPMPAISSMGKSDPMPATFGGNILGPSKSDPMPAGPTSAGNSDPMPATNGDGSGDSLPNTDGNGNSDSGPSNGTSSPDPNRGHRAARFNLKNRI